MNTIFNKLNATSSPIVKHRLTPAWICYDDYFILRINPCGKDYNGTYDTLKEMPIVARGFLVYNIVEKRYSFAERVQRYLSDDKVLYNDTYKHFIIAEYKNWFYIRLKLFKWLPKEERQILKKSFNLMKIKAKEHFKNK